VKNPDVDDYKKLVRVMRYLRGTIDMPLTLEADKMHVLKWWVDASYAVHPDMKSHTGGALSLGKGVVYGTSTRQRINTKSSTEAELVGVNDVLPQALWTRYFLEAQGYKVEDSIVFQDNQSAILLEKNGRASSSKRTRHINIRYFFITDRVQSKELRIEYCPTGDMLADFFTKPLQGSLFQKFRNQVMNIDPGTKLYQDHRSVLENESGIDTEEGWTVVNRHKNVNTSVNSEVSAGQSVGVKKTALKAKKTDTGPRLLDGHEEDIAMVTKTGMNGHSGKERYKKVVKSKCSF
jgi:hypothetical protein